MGVQAAEALEHAHGLGVIHRDVKPANLMVETRAPLAPGGGGAGGEGLHLWVTDFGLARLGGDAGLTLTGDLLGTLRYMSPEQALAQRVAVDARTDVYSLGVTLYELLTLVPAYGGRSREEVLRQIAFEEPRPPRRLNKAVPAELETVVLKAMAKSPDERYGSAAELADDLRRFLDDRVIRARRPTPWQRLRKWSRRHRTVLATLAAAAAVALVALLALSFRYNTELSRYNTELEEERDNALRKGEEARAEEKKARAALEKRRGILYVAHIQLAHREWQDAHLPRVLELLDGEGCPPDLRGWEWYYLRGLCRKEVRSLPAVPNQRPNCAAFSPDGRRLAVARAGADGGPGQGLIELWDLLTWRRVATFRGHTNKTSGAGTATCAAFSPDGRWLASGGDDRAVTVWDTETRKAAFTYHDGLSHTRKGELIGGVAFGPDGRRLVASSSFGDVWVLDVSAADPREWRRVSSQDEHKPPGGSGVAPLNWHELFAPAKPFAKGHEYCVAFSRHGRLASAGRDRTVKVWDAATGKCLATLVGHTQIVNALAFSPDGQTLA
jgi:hypothetical protein